MSIAKKLLQMSLAVTLGITSICPAVATAAPKEVPPVRVAMANEPVLDPAFVSDSYSIAVLANLLEGLTRINHLGEVQPGVAESWDVSEDGLVYTFKLRKDAKWTNGDPVVADDFIYAWKRVLDPATAANSVSKMYDLKNAEAIFMGEKSADELGVKAIDDHTLEVTLERPADYLPEMVGRQSVYKPVNRKAVEGNKSWAADAGENFITNGPYILSEWNHQSDFQLVKNPDYWNADKAEVTQLDAQIVEDPTTASALFQSGELDYIGIPFNTIPSEQLDLYRKNHNLHIKNLAAIYMYQLNTTDEVMKNTNIRRALSMGFNRQNLIDNVVKGDQQIATGAIAPTVKGFEEDRHLFKDGDYEEAKKLLAKGLEELGIKDPKDLPITIQTNEGDANMAVAQYIQNEWATHLGIKPQIKTAEINIHFESMNQKNYQIGRIGPAVDYNTAYGFLSHYYAKETSQNRTGWENPKYQELLDKLAVTKDEAEADQLAREAERILIEEMPFIPIYYYTIPFARNEKFQNLEFDYANTFDLLSVHYVE